MLNKNYLRLNGCKGVFKDRHNLIDDITEQANLLTLNSSIEASRSGDAEKGFAVLQKIYSKR